MALVRSSRYSLSSIPEDKENDDSEEEIWSKEVEDAFQEALVLFPNGKRRIKLNDGRCYGRNFLISQHIKNKCGKIRTPHQVASHLQVLALKRKAELQKIQSQIPVETLIGPWSYCNSLLGLTNFGAIRFLELQEDHKTDQYFTNIITFLSNTLDVLPYRKISGEKLALLYFLIYINEPNEYTDLVFKKTIFRGFTCASGMILPEVKISSLHRFYGSSINEIYAKTNQNSFYLIRSWNNQYYPENGYAESIRETAFYSPFLMDVQYKDCWYINGEHIYTTIICPMEVDEMISDQEKYYVYRSRLQYCTDRCNGKLCKKNHGMQHTFIKKFRKIMQSGDISLIRKILGSQPRLIIASDSNTQEILLVLAIINDYMPAFTGYQYYRVVP